MAYQTYTTDAFVIQTRDRIGADRMVRLLTRESGMLDARASGVREEKSKMRYALQTFSLARVTLVRGRREWRLIGAECGMNTFFAAANRDSRAHLLKLTKLIDRLVTGEEEHREFFSIVEDGVVHLALSASDDAYRVLVFRILTALGYVAPTKSSEQFSNAKTLEEALRAYVPSSAHEIDGTISAALLISQL